MKKGKQPIEGKKLPKKESKPKKKGSKMSKKPGFFTFVFKFANIVCILLLLLAYLAQYVSPVHYTWLAFIGLAYPPILLANALFILLWMIRRQRLFIYSLVVILLGWNVMFNHINIKFHNNINNKADTIKILSYNIDNFKFGLKKNQKIYTNRTNIIKFIKNVNPSIACFQEFFSEGKKDSLANDSLIKILDFKNYYYSNYMNKPKYKILDALAIFTDYDMINKGFLINKEKEKFAIYADIIINQDTVRLFNTHLTSIHLGSAIDSSQAKSVYRLWKAFQMRAYEVDLLADEMQASPYPIILCGDFNDTPASYTYHQLSANLDDTFKEAPTMIGNTYFWDMTPIRIDYILHNKSYKCLNYNVHKLIYSDHYAVTATLRK